MKVRYLLIAILFISSFADAQKIRFTNPTNVWKVYQDGMYWLESQMPLPHNFIFYYNGDTTVNGHTYLKMYSSTSTSFNCYTGELFREDTSAGYIYRIGAYDTVEKILFNYNLLVGDTINVNSNVSRVDSMDSTLINNIWHKVWYMSKDAYSYSIIEGLGSLNGADGCSLWQFMFFENFAQLTCFSTEGISPQPQPSIAYLMGDYVGAVAFDNDTSCLLPLSIKPLAQNNNSVKVIPNPADASAKINFAYAIPSGTLVIYDMAGKAVVQREFTDKAVYYFSEFPPLHPGIYFYKVTDDRAGKSLSGKFVYE